MNSPGMYTQCCDMKSHFQPALYVGKIHEYFEEQLISKTSNAPSSCAFLIFVQQVAHVFFLGTKYSDLFKVNSSMIDG